MSLRISKMHAVVLVSLLLMVFAPANGQTQNRIGREVAIAVHLKDGDEVQVPISDLLAFGGQLFQGMCYVCPFGTPNRMKMAAAAPVA